MTTSNFKSQIQDHPTTLKFLGIFLVIGFLDYWSGYEISFSIFYLIPIINISQKRGLKWGLSVSLAGMLSWGLCDYLTDHKYSSWWIQLWNMLMRGLIFAITSILVCKMRTAMLELEKAKESAVASGLTKATFLAQMSHEMRTPLNAILAIPYILLKTPLNSEQQNYIRIFRNEGENLLKTINDILDFSKIEANRLEPEIIPFDVAQMAEEVISLMQVRCHEKGLSFNLDMRDIPKNKILGDPTLLRRVLINLVGNAVKFTEKGQVKLNILASSSAHDRVSLLFSISDTGIGISAEKMKELFKPFGQADSSISRKYGGTGLGLVISQRIVEMMGGKLEVQSILNQGTVFSYSLDFDVATAAQNQESEKSNTDIDKMDSRPLKILLAEDYEANRIILRKLLDTLPYTLVEALHGQDALDKFKAQAFNLILMDIQMPVMDGYTAVREIRKIEKREGRTPTPIIALSAHAYKEDTERSLKEGCQAHLSKPIDIGALKNAILRFATDCKLENSPEKVKIKIIKDFSDYVPTYFKNIQQMILEAKDGLRQSDFEPSASSGHKLKGTGASFGFQTITDLGERLETAASLTDKIESEQVLKELEEYLSKVEVVYE
jgi:signal transduction histidine kinase/CheY-like chemotaxis protein/HPt (histidine-containing phosphotransfer) domain-containing protein